MQSFPFDSQIIGYDSDGNPKYDKPVNSAILSRTYSMFFKNGVLPSPSSGFDVSVGTGMTVTVSPGECIIEGKLGWEDTLRTLTVQASSSRYDRIDTVVLRRNLNLSYRNIDLYVVKGVESVAPQPPELTRDSSIYELGIANLFIAKNSTSISQSRITSTKLDPSRCGLSNPYATIDTTKLYNQIQADLAEFKNVNQADYEAWEVYIKDKYDSFEANNELTFNAWFANIQGQLDGDAATALQKQIDDIKFYFVNGDTLFLPNTAASVSDDGTLTIGTTTLSELGGA